MTGALIILAALVVVGGVLYLFHRRDVRLGKAQPPSRPPVADMPAGTEGDQPCCGLHITCEKDSLLAPVSETIDYFDDEELDAYRGRDGAAYSEEEIEQFRDVLLTLLPDKIAAWGRSIQLRGIVLPDCVREELLMIVAEARTKRTHNDIMQQ